MKKQKIGEILQQKADKAKDDKLVSALISADLSGLTKDQKRQKLKNIVDKVTK